MNQKHLNDLTLAELVDRQPSDNEAAHLGACDTCRLVLEDLRRQTDLLRNLTDPVAPEETWERVLEDSTAKSRQTTPGPFVRAAAAIALFLLGSGFGTFVVAPQISEGPAEPQVLFEDPIEELESAEQRYLRAAARVSALRGFEGVDVEQRLATLDGIVLTTAAALEEAPGDPLINTFHMAALGERESLAQELQNAPQAEIWY